ncbi:hypothetical protein LX59_00116 [Azomonas agilis]|uniref:Uncharacterized protein n=1 Tax=Azomonas agilis TaxID=116849 RepID=A0A562J274_9GAMM|nr:hypothetical protein LX59_00116 [Azomonas agilis]
MRGRVQAALVVAGAAAVPILFWLSAAACCLVLLRRGLSDGLQVAVWGAIPALVWWYLGEPRTALVLLGALALAILLRQGWSWQRVLLASTGLGLGYVALLILLFDDSLKLLAAEAHALLPTVMPEVWEKLSAVEREQLQQMFAAVLTGLLATLLQLLALVSLMLGRYWQALLYNPGGFGSEFRALRLSPVVAIGLCVGALAGVLGGPTLALLIPLCSLPLILASLALMHGLVAMNRMSKFWLVGLYVMLVLLLQVIYPLLAVLAVVDSLFDFRGRAARNPG